MKYALLKTIAISFYMFFCIVKYDFAGQADGIIGSTTFNPLFISGVDVVDVRSYPYY